MPGIEGITTEDGEKIVLFAISEKGISNSGGNACGVIDTWADFVPGTQVIAVFYVRNNSDKRVNVTFKWVNYMGGTGVESRGTVPPGDEINFGNLQNYGLIGYYSSAASYG